MAYEGIYVVTGIPGGGKTTFCASQVVKICETVPRTDDEASPVAVCSLTKSAAKEIASRDLPIPEWQVGTLHSMAYRQIGSPPVAEAEASDFNSSHPDMGVSADRDVDDTTGDVLVQNPEAPGNEAYQEYCLCRAEMRPRDQWSPNARYFAKLWEAWKTKNGLVDFCDMIDLAITDGKGHAPGDPSVIVVDECLAGSSTVRFEDGRVVTIRDVVERRLQGSVASFDHVRNRVCYKSITGWHKVHRRGRHLMKVGSLVATADHRVFVPSRGYVAIQDILDLGSNREVASRHENLRQLGNADATRKVDHCRIAPGGCEHFPQQGAARERSGFVSPRVQAAQVSVVEVPTTEALGQDTAWSSDQDGVRRGDVCLFDSQSPRVHRDLPHDSFGFVREDRDSLRGSSSGCSCACCMDDGRRFLRSGWREVGYIFNGSAELGGASQVLCGVRVRSTIPPHQKRNGDRSGHEGFQAVSSSYRASRRAIDEVQVVIRSSAASAMLPASFGEVGAVACGVPCVWSYRDARSISCLLFGLVCPHWRVVCSRSLSQAQPREVQDESACLCGLRPSFYGKDACVERSPLEPDLFREVSFAARRQQASRRTYSCDEVLHVRILWSSLQGNQTLETWRDVEVLFPNLQGAIHSGCTSRKGEAPGDVVHGMRKDLQPGSQGPEGASKDDVQQILLEPVGELETLEENDWVYCIDVDETHCFFADGILVKNCQDISIQEWQLLRVWYEAAGAIILSGDPYQSIFEWRGADSSIFFDPAIPADHRKFLNKSYRVPELVRDLSLRWLRDNLSDYHEITYNTRPESGTLGRFSSTTDFPDEVVGFVQQVLSSSESDTVMISASCGYMLRKTIAALRAEGIPFGNRWRRKRGDWNPLKAAPRGRATHFKLMTFYDMVTSKRSGTYADANDILTLLCVEGTLRQGAKTFFKQMAHDAGSSTVLLEDIRNVFLPEAWEKLAQAVSADTTGREFCGWVQEHAAAQKAGVLTYDIAVVKRYGFETLLHEPRIFAGTIHSFKGAEADHVIMFPDLSQAGDAAFTGPNARDRDGVVRTFYVGMTRAKKTLSICENKSRLAVDIPLDFV